MALHSSTNHVHTCWEQVARRGSFLKVQSLPPRSCFNHMWLIMSYYVSKLKTCHEKRFLHVCMAELSWHPFTDMLSWLHTIKWHRADFCLELFWGFTKHVRCFPARSSVTFPQINPGSFSKYLWNRMTVHHDWLQDRMIQRAGDRVTPLLTSALARGIQAIWAVYYCSLLMIKAEGYTWD